MGLFDLFGKKKSNIEKHAARVANKRAQNADRWESIQTLGNMAITPPAEGAPDEREAAIAALLTRFDFAVDPSITDGEEKDAAFRWILEAGETAVAPAAAALRTASSSSWPLKVLGRLLSEQRLVEEMIAVLGTMDTEYERDPQRKLQILASFEEQEHPGIVEAAIPFLEDVNETARFHAVGAILAQGDIEKALEALQTALEAEDSLRVKARALDGLADRNLPVGKGFEDKALPTGYRLDKKRVPQKK